LHRFNSGIADGFCDVVVDSLNVQALTEESSISRYASLAIVRCLSRSCEKEFSSSSRVISTMVRW
jgi:hypothetical protein